MANKYDQGRRSLPISLHGTTDEKLRKSMKLQILKLEKERDELRDQVVELANFNYAREPEFVKDRMRLREKLEDVADLKRIVASKWIMVLNTVMTKLEANQTKLSTNALRLEEDSEQVARAYLEGKLKHDQFIDQYIQLRKDASRARALADKLTKEKNILAQNWNNSTSGVIVDSKQESPKPAARQRKKVCFDQ